VRPPRGSNVRGGEMLSTLLLLEDVRGKDDEGRIKELEGWMNSWREQWILRKVKKTSHETMTTWTGQ